MVCSNKWDRHPRVACAGLRGREPNEGRIETAKTAIQPGEWSWRYRRHPDFQLSTIVSVHHDDCRRLLQKNSVCAHMSFRCVQGVSRPNCYGGCQISDSFRRTPLSPHSAACAQQIRAIQSKMVEVDAKKLELRRAAREEKEAATSQV